ncbi:RILP-like protein 1 isoform X2 [Melanotaenia boesemani]|uniref:RILP-like protein 1 isoform X2 n=1 Tax=Melanotaenia boesemani TaxID=1250792 RepID=UPI001C055976|nr:RILP-like protein 1 isoform X2 [Melanotaenia boesemani]
MSALDRPAADLTVMDVYDIAAVIGQDFERVIDKFGCECLVGVIPHVVRVLEFLETLVSRGAARQEVEELQREVDRLRQERSDRYEQERKHQKELEQVEDVWRGEVQDMLSQIAQLKAENKRLLVSLSLKESPITEEDLQKHDGMSETENQVMKRLKDLVDKQRDEIRAKDNELLLRNDDVEALQLQQHRLIKINQDLLHKVGVMEAQGKAVIQQRAELEAAAQARQQELGALQLEVAVLRKELKERELQKELAEIEESSLSLSEMSPPLSALITSPSTTPFNPIKPKSVWMECGGDPSFVATCFECDKSLSVLPKSAKGEKHEENVDKDKDTAAQFPSGSTDTELEEEPDSPDQEIDKPRFTLQELRDVLLERNELKAQVFMLQEELAYYKSEELEDDISPDVSALSLPSHSPSTDQPESGIRRLIFTAIMPMVAAGLITDDPTLLPIRRLVSFI